ncbi:hypothetical protein LCGC14_1057170 [marine sediment metagenome]|uniref:Uncharacterized protein n=1 Tax=marine sediment metagenome TaxID=412755 RepID=A0A0F9MM91_9ZZZZ
MGARTRFFEDYQSSRESKDFVLNSDASITLSAFQQTCIANTTGATHDTITLPSMADAKGKIYSVYFKTQVSTGDVIVVGAGDEATAYTKTITVADGWVVCYCDGYNWYSLDEKLS